MAPLEDKEIGVSVAELPTPMASDCPFLRLEKPSLESLSVSQVPTQHDEHNVRSTNPCSAFYSHPSTRTSLEQLHPTSTTKTFDVDTEAASGRTSMAPSTRPIDPSKKYCTVWPEKENLEQEAREQKERRVCFLFRGRTRKQKHLIKIFIALVIVGVAVGIGVGISIKVGGSVYRGNDKQTGIGSG